MDELKTAAVISAPPQTLPIGILPIWSAAARMCQAEAELHAATAEVGVAEADFYPRIWLTGGLGGETLQLADLGWSSRQLAVGPFVVFTGSLDETPALATEALHFCRSEFEAMASLV